VIVVVVVTFVVWLLFGWLHVGLVVAYCCSVVCWFVGCWLLLLLVGGGLLDDVTRLDATLRWTTLRCYGFILRVADGLTRWTLLLTVVVDYVLPALVWTRCGWTGFCCVALPFSLLFVLVDTCVWLGYFVGCSVAFAFWILFGRCCCGIGFLRLRFVDVVVVDFDCRYVVYCVLVLQLLVDV